MTRMIMITAALFALLSAGTANAAPQWAKPDRAKPASTASWHFVQRQITPQEARAIALSRVPGGEVVDIRRTSNAYRVRIIARNGQVIDIIVDATTGRIR
ncbi:MAG: PepSY domain-containing protein [Pseudomonadota bacterium]